MLLISTHIDTNFWGNFNQNYHVNWWKDHTHNTCHALSNQNDALECFENNYIQRDIYKHNYAVKNTVNTSVRKFKQTSLIYVP